jgi:hypothetical protein
MNIEQNLTTNRWGGRTQPIKEIVIHWWDDPARKPTINGVINHFKNPASQVSAHYVVSGTRIVRLVREQDTAWHIGHANPFTIGIEVDPRGQDSTYKTVAWLVNDIRKRRGNLPLVGHNKYMNTACPGTISISRINKESKELDMYRNRTAKEWYERAVELDGYRNNWRDKANKLEKELKSLKSSFKVLEKQVEILTAQNNALKANNDELVDELRKSNKAVKTNSETIQTLEKELAKSDETIEKLKNNNLSTADHLNAIVSKIIERIKSWQK